jgi:N-acetylneuraminate lyase
MREEMKGLYAALLVPYDEQGRVKEKALKEFALNAIDNEGLDGLYVNGSSGRTF